MKSTISIIFVLSLILSGCGGTNTPEPTISEKAEFHIKTLELKKANGGYNVEKSARLTAGSALTLTSDGIGQVDKILVKEWQSVKKWQTIIQLKDTTAMYGLQMQQAGNGVTSANAGREATIANLDQSITNAEIARAQAQRAYDTLVKDTKERRKQAENDFFNANPNNTGSTAQLNIEKLKLDLASAENNYQNQLTSLDASYHLYANDFEKLSNSMLFEADRILGITSTYQYTNDGWEAYLGAYIWNVKVTADNAWGKLYEARGSIRAKQSIVITPQNAKAEIDALISYYQIARDMGAAMDNMLQNSVVGWGLSRVQLDAWIGQWTGFRASTQASEAQFIAWKSSAMSTIPSGTGAKSVAEMNIDSLKFQISAAERNIKTGNDSATIWYTRTLIALDDQLKAAKLAYEQAEKNLAAAKRNREATAKQLGASVSSASTSLSLARANYDKLLIKSPVDGKITKISVSVGQNVNAGGPVGEVASNMPEMLVDTEADVALNLENGDTVTVEVGWTTLTGVVSAVSHIANTNLLYSTRISMSTGTDLIGQAAKIIFNINNSNDTPTSIYLPLININIISENEWEIFLLSQSGSELLPKRESVKLWNIRGDSIEVINSFPEDTIIILNDVSNFDSTKQKLVIEKLTVSGE
jgi:multidrug efflux pump subunit AcrA (membrane-fusion protein)